jgi:lipoate-protein ligase B
VTSAEALDVRRLGRVSYRGCLEQMRALVDARAKGAIRDTLLLVEHDAVFTAGRRDAAEDLVDTSIEVVQIERGGRITYHGPGQLVAYPIVALEGARRDLHAWLRLLEDVIIDTLSRWTLVGRRDPKGTGVFVEDRKIASIGIAVRRWISFHGLALNVTTDLDAFTAIRPCGFDSDVMTSLERELGAAHTPTLTEVGDVMATVFAEAWV